jgi:hypothetical protein
MADPGGPRPQRGMAASRFAHYKTWRQPDQHGFNYKAQILTINFAEYFPLFL